MYDISDDDLPEDVQDGLKAKGWRFDADHQEWRWHNDQGSFSPHQADHQRAFDVDVAAVIAALAADTDEGGDQMRSEQVRENDDNYAPADEDTGTEANDTEAAGNASTEYHTD